MPRLSMLLVSSGPYVSQMGRCIYFAFSHDSKIRINIFKTVDAIDNAEMTECGSIKKTVRARVASNIIEKKRYMMRVEDGLMFRPCSKYESSNKIANVASDSAAAVMDDQDLSVSWMLHIATNVICSIP